MNKAERGLSSNAIKLIAIIAMCADHVAWTVFPGFNTQPLALTLHAIGRIAAPCMFFFIAEGFYHTKSVKAYAVRLFILAVISHFAYCFCFGIPFNSFRTSVIWGLLCGLILLYISSDNSLDTGKKTLLIIMVLALSIPADWSVFGAAAILFMGSCRGDFKRQMLLFMLCMAAYALTFYYFNDKTYGLLQLATFFAVPILALYNGKRGESKGLGRFFYVFYPAHLALLGLLRVILSLRS